MRRPRAAIRLVNATQKVAVWVDRYEHPQPLLANRQYARRDPAESRQLASLDRRFELSSLLDDGRQARGIAERAGRQSLRLEAGGVRGVEFLLRLFELALAAQFDQPVCNGFDVHKRSPGWEFVPCLVMPGLFIWSGSV